MEKEYFWQRKQQALEYEAQNIVNLICEKSESLCLVFSERYHGFCVSAPNENEALKKLDGELNVFRNWGYGGQFDCVYKPQITQRLFTETLSEDNSKITFAVELKPFPAKTYAKMKELALKSAEGIAELYNSLPDPDFKFDQAMSGRDTVKHLNGLTGRYAAYLGEKYNSVGNLFADRRLVIKALEKPGYMKNTVFTSENKETWSYRKVLRHMIWHDRLHARALYAAAVKKWGEDKINNPFRF